MLGKNFPVITPTQKDSRMSFTERSATPSRNPSPRQLDHSTEILLCVESLQQPSTPTKDVVRRDHSGEVSDSLILILYSFHIDGFTEEGCFQGL